MKILSFQAVSNGLPYEGNITINFSANNIRPLKVVNISYDSSSRLLSWQSILRDGTIIADYQGGNIN